MHRIKIIDHDVPSTTHETQRRRGFTIDFTSYKVLIIIAKFMREREREKERERESVC